MPLAKLGRQDYIKNIKDDEKAQRCICKMHITITGRVVRQYYYIHTILGWILVTLLIGAFTGLIKS
jgi:hypothetical protein